MLASVKAHGFDRIMLCDRSGVPPLDDEEWHRKDQFLFSWLLSSINESMLGYVNMCEHSFEVWQIFEELFRSQSKARAMHLRYQMQTLKKGNLSVGEFFFANEDNC